MYNQGPIYEKSFKFALQIIALVKKLYSENEYVLSKQLLRSATSIGANAHEASAAESKKDFKHKMAIASKEARETLYWLMLLEESELTQTKILNEIKDCTELVKMLTAIVKSSDQARKTKH